MKSRQSRFLPLALIVFFSVIISVFSTGYLSKRTFKNHDLHGVSRGELTHDGWIGTQLNIGISGFAGFGNKVRLHLGHIRPGADEVPLVGVSLCGSPWKNYEIGGPEPVEVAIPFGCSPLHVSVKSLRYFYPATEKKPRRLGTQLHAVSIASWIGVPIVQWWLVFAVATFFGLLGYFISEVARESGVQSRYAIASAACLSLGLVLLSGVSESKFPPVMVLGLGSILGMWLYIKRREVPPFRESKVASFALICLAMVVATTLRFYGISFGLPANFHPDEVPKVNAIMRMVDQKTLDPQYFLHPSLLLYASYAMNSFLHLLGVEGSFRETAFLAGRLVSATAGVFSVFLVYLLGTRLYSRMVGSISALLLASFPLHVTCSRYMKEDALLTFVILLCLYTTIVAVQSNKRWLLIFGGLLAGASAGVKYSGLLMILVPAMAPWLSSRSLKPDRRWLLVAAAAVIIAPLGFVATTPFSLLNSAKFLKDFHSESRHMQTGHTVTITAWSQLWSYHLWRSIRPGVTLPVTIFSCVAFGYLLRRSKVEDLIVVGMALLFYLPAEFVKAKPAPQPERYILPCLPFIAIGLGVVVQQVRAHRAGYIRLGISLASIALIIFPLSRSALLARDVADDTRDRLADWMIDNLPHGSKVLMDWKPYCPNFHGEYFTVEHIPRAKIIPELSVHRLRNSGANYLILSSLFYDRYFSQPESAAILRQRFREVFKEVPIVRQFKAPTGTYGFHNPTLTLFSLDPNDFAQLDEQRSQAEGAFQQQIEDGTRAMLGW